jgi:hypothetical protein
MPQSIPEGLTAEHVRLALSELDAGVEHPFGSPTGYEVVHEGRRYPPKAVIGLAFRHLRGEILSPEAFSGGEAPGQANFVLRNLGFIVGKKGVSTEADARPEDWSAEEVDLIVADYFEMLRLDLADRPFSKSERNQALRGRLNRRSKGSVEFKHQNISAALVDLELPYLRGYKPAKNYQKRLLPQAIEAYIEAHPGLHDQIAASPVMNPDSLPPAEEGDPNALFVPRPDRMAVASRESKPWLSRRGRKVDYARRDAINRHLGRLGEQFTLDLERRCLKAAQRNDLAARVEWISETCGDGLGFDILSFDPVDDTELFLEIKTTCLELYFPFIVTENERRCSEDVGDRFQLYRVFDFSRRPRLYVLPGALSKSCQLEPMQYRASATI